MVKKVHVLTSPEKAARNFLQINEFGAMTRTEAVRDIPQGKARGRTHDFRSSRQ
ncbi:hypothetical protein ACFRFL_33375 [Streptomyces sp. NPDC056708]|uniref:hypothetical protein n=1 Tax=unclassified Streptomyces TaxID=2593676 RepID=UPI0036737D65